MSPKIESKYVIKTVAKKGRQKRRQKINTNVVEIRRHKCRLKRGLKRRQKRRQKINTNVV